MYEPDFLIKPYAVYSHPELRPSDSDVYAVVYWFEKMKDGKCTASNETIARVACIKERSVGASLERLEQHGFITRVFSSDTKAHRVEIKTHVHMTREAKPAKTVHKTTKRSNPVKDVEMEPGAIVPVELEDPTPQELARDFFAPEGETSDHRKRIVEEVIEKTGIPADVVWSETKKFYLYWTERTKNGKKQLWETKTTFEVKLRLYTWLSRASGYNNKTARRSAGAGATI
jgi:DNA-binding MarR family transcriptional regulator